MTRHSPLARIAGIVCRGALVAVVAPVAVGCAMPHRVPNLAGLYDRAARAEGPHRNPVIVIPGILGTRLRDPATGTVVWGAFAGSYANPRSAEGARLLALPMREGAPLDALTDEIEPDGVLDRVRVSVLSLPIEQKAYVNLLATLGVGGYRDESLGRTQAIDYGDAHFTCFQFPYDWRRDIAENARRLDGFIREKRAYVQAEIQRRFGVANADVKFDLVAHSMGGLLARWYLMYGATDLPPDGTPAITWAGARDVERAVLVGTPNGGSVDALLQLVRGAEFSWILPKFPAAVLGTMPAIYELLPRARQGRIVSADDGAPVDVFDPTVWERFGWGLAAPDQDRVLAQLLPDAPSADARRRIALDHLRKSLDRARRFTDAIDTPSHTPAGLTLQLIAGDAEPTEARVAVAPSGALRVVAEEPGDGTVLRASALGDERADGRWSPQVATPIDWTHVSFIFRDHLGLTEDAAFTDNLLYVLLEQPERPRADGRGDRNPTARSP